MDIQSLLRDLHQHGAEDYGRLQKVLSHDRLEDLVEARVLRRQETPVGEGVVLGSQGRRALGLSPYYLSPPEVAATQIVRRHLRERLEADGYIYVGVHERTLLIFDSPQGRRVYLMAQWRPIRARSVKRILDRLRSQLLREGTVLLIATRQPYYLRYLREANGGLVELLVY